MLYNQFIILLILEVVYMIFGHHCNKSGHLRRKIDLAFDIIYTLPPFEIKDTEHKYIYKQLNQSSIHLVLQKLVLNRDQWVLPIWYLNLHTVHQYYSSLTNQGQLDGKKEREDQSILSQGRFQSRQLYITLYTYRVY